MLAATVLFAFAAGWLIGGSHPWLSRGESGTAAPAAGRPETDRGSRVERDPMDQPVARISVGNAAQVKSGSESAPPSEVEPAEPTVDPGIHFAESMLSSLDTPSGRLTHGYRDTLALQTVLNDKSLNIDGLHLDADSEAALRVLLDSANERVNEASLDMQRQMWRCAVHRIQSGDFANPPADDPNFTEKLRRSAEEPFANRPGLNVLIGGVPNGSGSGPNRVLVWARGDRYGVIEAWDAVEAAKAARGDAIRGFFAKLHGGR